MIVAAFACGKKRTCQYTGVVVDSFGQPVDSVTIGLMYDKGASNISDGESSLAVQTENHADGTFDFSFTFRKKESANLIWAQSPKKQVEGRPVPMESQNELRIVIPN
jgi:hypothetical protein